MGHKGREQEGVKAAPRQALGEEEAGAQEDVQVGLVAGDDDSVLRSVHLDQQQARVPVVALPEEGRRFESRGTGLHSHQFLQKQSPRSLFDGREKPLGRELPLRGIGGWRAPKANVPGRGFGSVDDLISPAVAELPFLDMKRLGDGSAHAERQILPRQVRELLPMTEHTHHPLSVYPPLPLHRVEGV